MLDTDADQSSPGGTNKQRGDENAARDTETVRPAGQQIVEYREHR